MTEESSGHLLGPSVVPCGGGHRHRRFIGSPAVVEVACPLTIHVGKKIRRRSWTLRLGQCRQQRLPLELGRKLRQLLARNSGSVSGFEATLTALT